MVLIAIILGALLGASMGRESFGALAGALIAWLVLQWRQQQARIATLEKALAASPAPQGAAASQASGETAAIDSAAAAAAAADAASLNAELQQAFRAMTTSVPVESAAQAMVGPPATQAGAPMPAPEFERVTPTPPSLAQQALAWFLGGNTIAKAGIGILFVGLAFLAKYAAEHSQIPVELRLAGIGAVALALLGVGWRLRLKRPSYAQALQGGAVAVLYLTLFVAFRFYGVVAAAPAFGLMVAVAAAAAALAVLQDARALAVIGALGGFATPLLVSNGGGNPAALFSYYLVLDLGIAAVAWFKTWRLLNAVGFVFTFAVATFWGGLAYDPQHYASGQTFLAAYFLLFNAVLLLPARRLIASDAPRNEAWINGGLMFGLPTITFVLQHGLVRDMPYGTALSALALAAFYVAMASRLKRHSQLALPFNAALAVATVFLTLVVPFALDARSTAGAWALEGAGLIWLGLRQGRRLPRAFGYALQLLAGGAFLLALTFGSTPSSILNTWLLNSLLLAAGSLAAAFFLHKSLAQAGPRMPVEQQAHPALIGVGTLWALVAVALQVDTVASPPFELATGLAGLSVLAAVYAGLCIRLSWPGIAAPLTGFAPLLALGVLVSGASLGRPDAFGGWWAWSAALAMHLVVLRHAAPHWPVRAQHAVHALGVLVLAALGALEGRGLTATWGDAGSAWAWLGWLVVPAVLLVLLTRARATQPWPIHAAPRAYTLTASGVLAAALLLWTLLANAFSDGAATPLPFLPLLNPLDLGVAAGLLAAWVWMRSPAAQTRPALQPPVPIATVGFASFVWLNAMLVRCFHHYGGVPFRFASWVDSLPVQTGLTLLWSFTALVLMWLSARRKQRLLWMVGAGLLGAVVLKLLGIDLSGSGTVTRIVSFIGVGVLMLVIAYVAPLPARAAMPGATEDRLDKNAHATL